MTHRVLVLLEDSETWLHLWQRALRPLAERDRLSLRAFTDDRDAAEFVVAHRPEIVGVIQDLYRPDASGRIYPAGLHFLDGIIRLLTPHARVAIISGNLHRDECKHLALERSVLAFDKPPSLDDLKRAYEWVSSATTTEVPQRANDEDGKDDVALITAVSVPWLEVRRSLALDPTLLHRMPSRRFEELVAEIYRDHGWEVQLTAPIKDGGFDIIALRRGTPTELKVLVEAKRYSPDRAVGVGLIRSLYATRSINRASQVVLATSSHVSLDARTEFRSVIPHELAFLERDAILAWCRQTHGQILGGFEPKV